MAIAINPRKKRTLVLAEDQELAPEQQTRFFARDLTPSETAEVTDMRFWERENAEGRFERCSRPASQALYILTRALTGWENLRDADGNEVAPPEDTNERIALLSEANRLELANLIRFGGEVTVEEGK